MTKAAAAPDLSEFFRLSRPKKKPCPIGFVLPQLSDEERVQFEAAIATDRNIITSSAIIGWLEKRGHTSGIGHNAITAHSKRTCTCGDA